MRIERVELRRVRMPLVRPFQTSFGVETVRDILLVHITTSEAEGWGECVTQEVPLYSSEYTDGAVDVMRRHLLPSLLQADDLTAADVGERLKPFRGHPMAKAAIEMALLDAEGHLTNEPLSTRLGADKDAVECGVSVGIQRDLDRLVEEVSTYVAAGYRRIKLKIEPGFDVQPVRAIYRAFPDVPLQVDANAAYTRDDGPTLAALDRFDLVLVEQPLPEDDLLGHAEIARQMDTPICLDESITSAAVANQALELGACAIVNIKAGRVGGYLEAVRIHDVCRERDIPVWCGGMLETGLGRAANVALAALPGFTLPGDTSASDRYWAEDLTEPFVLQDGQLRVPVGPGIGVAPRPEALDAFTTWSEEIRP